MTTRTPVEWYNLGVLYDVRVEDAGGLAVLVVKGHDGTARVTLPEGEIDAFHERLLEAAAVYDQSHPGGDGDE